MHICGKDFHERQEGLDVEEEYVYVLDLEDSFAEKDEEELVMKLENAVEEMDAKFSTKEIREMGNKKFTEWGAIALMFMLLSVAVQWASQAQMCLNVMQEEQNDVVGYVNPYVDDPWSVNDEDEFGYVEPRIWNAMEFELVFGFKGMKWYVCIPDWERTIWPFDPGGWQVFLMSTART